MIGSLEPRLYQGRALRLCAVRTTLTEPSLPAHPESGKGGGAAGAPPHLRRAQVLGLILKELPTISADEAKICIKEKIDVIEIPEFNFTNIGTYASLAGLGLSILILIKSRSIKNEISIVKSRIILKKRLPEMLAGLNLNLSNINKLLIELEKNEARLKEELVECQSLVNSLLPKINEDSMIRDLKKINISINILKRKNLLRNPKKLKVVMQIIAQYRFWPYAYEYNILTIKNDLSKIYNDLDHISSDQREV
nr:hypothetical protein [uncultured Desulfobulbus sp.]